MLDGLLMVVLLDHRWYHYVARLVVTLLWSLESHLNLPRDATQEEIYSRVHEVADIPLTAWLLSFIGAAAQFTRFGITITWQNYIQNPRGSNPSPGVLGFGQAKASIIQNAYLFLQYLTPLPSAILLDMWLGRYKTMIISF
ncbi:hypothetical protein F4808DRAFT_441892 [Astrocystis sublimbata]|nr:hypothetical protein F4808DRAFT_441892 [Astrocystis sublimbata]